MKDQDGQEEETNKGNRGVPGEELSDVVTQRQEDAALERKWLEHAGPDKIVIEQEDELLRAEKEAEEHKTNLQEVEEKHKQEAKEKRSSLQSELNYSYYSSMGFLSLHEISTTTNDDEDDELSSETTSP
ncbi:uncharacterized protein LOC121392617 [Gigantopelta aegis]|uniref:uncharacterized protein LOC121392617 n=1 Tax=Gigantopelta aegis TaxID=1735272 RepID=UPI001B88783B|nr:uncharacterized protein LOC121392617 [Gigantopelta aegis]